MDATGSLSPRTRRALDTGKEILGSLALLGIIGAIIYFSFGLVDDGMRYVGLTHEWWQSFVVWYASGLLCAFYWPFKYRHNMGGHWLRSLPELLLLGLTGPFAIILGFPV